jgi:hypothetical protein
MKKKRSPKISSEFALLLVLTLAVFVGLAAWIGGHYWVDSDYSVNQPVVRSKASAVSSSDASNGSDDAPKLESRPVADAPDWKVHKDQRYGFEVQYPSDYEAHLGDWSTNDPTFYIKNPRKDINKGLQKKFAFSLNVNENLLRGYDGTFKDPEEWLKNEERSGVSYIKTAVDGRVAYKKASQDSHDSEEEYIVFINNGSSYDMYGFFLKPDDIGRDILSTFKFIR